MFRVFLATYLALFACFLPALHTCVPVAGHHEQDAAAHEAVAPPDHHDHRAHGHDDLCIVCRLSGDSGGIVAPPFCGLAVVQPVGTRVEREQPVRRFRLAPEENLPRAPPV